MKLILKVKGTYGQKVFCIGFNKTGTTSLGEALSELGLSTAPQRPAENLIDAWAKRDFRKLIKFCKTAGNAFQDVPFSLPYTYVILDNYFPNSKFILTVRNDSEEWYNSYVNYHAKIWSKSAKVPTKEDLLDAIYIYKSRPWHTNRLLFTTPKELPYKKEVLIEFYENHNKSIIEYFRHKPGMLLKLNVAESGSYQKLAKFLNVKTNKTDFPWLNATEK